MNRIALAVGIILAAAVAGGVPGTASAQMVTVFDSFTYGFDLSGYSSFVSPANNYTLTMHFTDDLFDPDDILHVTIKDSSSKKVFDQYLYAYSAGSGAPLSDFAISISNDTYMSQIYSTLTGSVTIGMANGSVNLVGLQSTLRDSTYTSYTVTQLSPDAAPTPIPPSIALFGSTLLGWVGLRRTRSSLSAT